MSTETAEGGVLTLNESRISGGVAILLKLQHLQTWTMLKGVELHKTLSTRQQLPSTETPQTSYANREIVSHPN